MAGQLYCGAARENITPDSELLPKLYGIMKTRFCSVNDDIYLRVICLSDGKESALVVGFDLDKATQPEKFIKVLSEFTDIPENNIFYFAIHTHTAPATGPRKPFEQPPDEEAAAATAEYEDFILDRLLSAAIKAKESMVPVKMGVGYGNSYINANRNQVFHYTDQNGKKWDYLGNGINPEGIVDHTAAVVRFDDMDGNTVAILMNYAVHNVAMICNDADGHGRAAISSDIGGIVSKHIERQTGAVALWSSGAAGDINPVMLNQFFYSNPRNGERNVYMVEGDSAAKAALKLMSMRHLDDIKQINEKIVCDDTDAIIKGSMEYANAPLRSGEGEYRVLMQALRIGDLVLVGSAGELYTRLGSAIKEKSPLKDTLVINHNRSLMADCGYVYDDETSALFDENCPVKGDLPGGGQGKTAPGTIKPALEKSTEMLMKNIGLL